MVPVDQTKLHSEDTKGNCFSASLASILELPIEDIPEFEEMDKDVWWNNFIHWLEGLGFGLAIWREEIRLPGYYLVMGVSPRDPKVNHQVVYHNGQMIHDPHPSRDGLVKIKEVIALIPFDPAQYKSIDAENFIQNRFGYCFYEIKLDSALIYNLFIHPIYRRNGRAKDLLQLIIREIRKEYQGQIQIECVPKEDGIDLEKLISFYRSMGLETMYRKGSES